MATAGVLKYLKSTNRPYSANDIVQNMHKEFGKAAVQKALDDLVTNGEVCEKLYGKQKIYCIKQSGDDQIGEAELKDLESETEKTSLNYKTVEQQLKETENCLRQLLSSPTNLEAKDQVAALEAKLKTSHEKLNKLSQNTFIISQEERLKINYEHEKLVKEYRKRKRICMEIINAIMEGYPKSKKALLEEAGIETDEDVNMPSVNLC